MSDDLKIMTWDEFEAELDEYYITGQNRWGALWDWRPERLKHRLSEAWWYVRGVLWDRHHVLKVKTLPPTWTDRDHRLLHANFQILTDFIEEELKTRPDPSRFDEIGDKEWWGMIKERDDIKNELWDMYEWWHHGRDKE